MMKTRGLESGKTKCSKTAFVHVVHAVDILL